MSDRMCGGHLIKGYSCFRQPLTDTLKNTTCETLHTKAHSPCFWCGGSFIPAFDVTFKIEKAQPDKPLRLTGLTKYTQASHRYAIQLKLLFQYQLAPGENLPRLDYSHMHVSWEKAYSPPKRIHLSTSKHNSPCELSNRMSLWKRENYFDNYVSAAAARKLRGFERVSSDVFGFLPLTAVIVYLMKMKSEVEIEFFTACGV